MDYKYKILLNIAVLAIMVFLVSKQISYHDLTTTLNDFPSFNLILLFGISFLISTLKSLRFLFLLKNMNIYISFWENLKIFLAGQSTSPLPGGEALRGILLHKKKGVKAAKTSGPIITQAVIELIAAAFLTLIGSFMFGLFRVPAVIIATVIIILLLLLLKERWFEFICSKIPKWKFLSSLPVKALSIRIYIVQSLNKSDQKSDANTFIKSFIIAIITNILGGVLIMIIASSFNQNLNIFKSIFAYSSNIVIQGLTTPGGIGFAEGGMLGLLLLYKLKLSIALAIVIIFRFTTLIFNILVGILFLLVFYNQQILFSKKYEKNS